MNLFLSFLMGFLSIGIVAQVKTGDNPGKIGTSSLLELESTNKVIIPRVANSATTTPVACMLIYDNSQSCFILYQGGSWSPCIEKKNIDVLDSKIL